MARVSRVIEACDRNGGAVILGCFYQRQDQVLADEAAVRAGFTNVVRWLRQNGYRNVMLEVANEFGHGGFDHDLLKSADGQVALVRLAKREWPELLVSTSGMGDGRLPDSVAAAADFLLVHLNGASVDKIPKRVAALKRFAKPIVCNEDDKDGEAAAGSATASVRSGASWGLMLEATNQRFPFRFDGADDDPVAYAMLKKLTTPIE